MSERQALRPQFSSSVTAKSLPLFQKNSGRDAAPGSLNDDSLTRRVITIGIKRSGKSREQIADAMSIYLGLKVTARMLACFTAESKELHRWPGAWDRAFCAATGDDALLKCRAEAAGYRLIRDDEIYLLELGRHFLRRKRADAEVEILERRLAGSEVDE